MLVFNGGKVVKHISMVGLDNACQYEFVSCLMDIGHRDVLTRMIRATVMHARARVMQLLSKGVAPTEQYRSILERACAEVGLTKRGGAVATSARVSAVVASRIRRGGDVVGEEGRGPAGAGSTPGDDGAVDVGVVPSGGAGKHRGKRSGDLLHTEDS